MRSLLSLALLCFLTPAIWAQPTTYALPTHKGAAVLDLQGWQVTQRTAKPGGRELGVRAHDAQHTEMLAFLFLTPDHKAQTAASCLNRDLQQVRKDNGKFTEQRDPFHHESPDSATVLLTYASARQVLYRYFGSGDQCLLFQIYPDKGTTLDLQNAVSFLDRQHYDPSYNPSPDDVALYEGIRGQAIQSANQPPATVPENLVSWYGPGAIHLPVSPDWKLELLTAYNGGARPVAQFTNEKTSVTASLIIFENLSGTPSPSGCRGDVLPAIRKNEGALISASTEATTNDGHGGGYATASHLTLLPGGAHNYDVFAFAGNKRVCAEIHASTISGKPDEESRLQAALALFRPDLDYAAKWTDYFQMATALYEKDPLLAAPFFDSSLKIMPSDPGVLNPRRLATDVVTVVLERMGNLKRSRQYAQQAIESDPDYPMSYYHLACIDAAEHHPEQARTHLEQAFARKANIIAGEHMPDPTKDESLLKLRKDKNFWNFVESLPKD